MELSKDEIKEIIRDVKEGYGHDVTVKDIAFCVLSKVFNDEELAFKVLHGGKVGKKEREKINNSLFSSSFINNTKINFSMKK